MKTRIRRRGRSLGWATLCDGTNGLSQRNLMQEWTRRSEIRARIVRGEASDL